MDPITWGGKVLRGKIIRHPDMKPFSLQRAVLQMFLDCPDVSKNDLNKIKTAIKEFMTTQENPAVKKVCQTILDR